MQEKFGGQRFDAIMMGSKYPLSFNKDPPWQLATSSPSRGVAIAYSSLSDQEIQALPIKSLQDNGFIFLW